MASRDDASVRDLPSAIREQEQVVAQAEQILEGAAAELLEEGMVPHYLQGRVTVRAAHMLGRAVLGAVPLTLLAHYDDTVLVGFADGGVVHCSGSANSFEPLGRARDKGRRLSLRRVGFDAGAVELTFTAAARWRRPRTVVLRCDSVSA